MKILSLVDLQRYSTLGRTVGEMETICQPTYSTEILTKGWCQHTVKFFNRPVDAERSYDDTNMELPGQFPSSNMFLVWGFAVSFAPRVAELIERGVFTFIVGSTLYYTYSPLNTFERISPKYVITPHDTTYDNNYVPHKIESPIVLMGGQNFCAELRWPKGVKLKQDIRARIELCGFKYRNCQ